MNVKYNSFCRSEKQRREQGGCEPPDIEPTNEPRYEIPVGTRVQVRQVQGARWQRYTVCKTVTFRTPEEFQRGCYVVRHLGWLIRVPVGSVKDRCKSWLTRSG